MRTAYEIPCFFVGRMGLGSNGKPDLLGLQPVSFSTPSCGGVDQ